METLEKITRVESVTRKTSGEENFVPKGAIAFFILLVLLGLTIWFGIYFLMLSRV